ncbi:hydrogenase accessory protein HypB [Deferribacter desulfuricans SSM1]|uniref:Hydrogenase accessory protein HypB n=1 Tax=Deferribacter desulfuricans (strain DSM 14783 / JCM 11476 / NBRC 101012 / SSM1) TaxID=639282 RepID=D3PAS0_DEFDS|nr:hydrogenase nickel incorporation protein HypB [Deferribacter desulfuricans]BAI79693.1 hydrogenase accessory protein HypB [Deferribacter desulfuricans SSM1]
MKNIKVETKILTKNEQKAKYLRMLFRENNVLVLNFLSSPGSGKTSLLENILPILKEKYNVGVIEGDLATEHDAERIRQVGVTCYQINTHGACHLESNGIEKALSAFSLDELDILIIENVGNLVCPASFDLGEDYKIVLISTTEGEDKPIKYPTVIRASSAMIINKTDLLQVLDFDVEKCKDYAKGINPDIEIFETSCKTKAGINDVVNWIEEKYHAKTGLCRS